MLNFQKSLKGVQLYPYILYDTTETNAVDVNEKFTKLKRIIRKNFDFDKNEKKNLNVSRAVLLNLFSHLPTKS